MELSYCGSQLRKYDSDHFILGMFVPEDIRETWFSLYAFNAEVSKISNSVSDVNIGLIRLQWWQDSIDKIYRDGKAQDHEILTPLANAVKNHDLNKEYFDQYFDTYALDIEGVEFQDIDDVLRYNHDRLSPLFSLSAQILGGHFCKSPSLLGNIINSYGLITTIRQTYHYASKGRSLLPIDLSDVKPDSEILQKSVLEICNKAQESLSQIDLEGIDKKALSPLLLHVTLAKQYLNQIQKCDYSIFDGRMDKRPFAQELCLYYAHLLGRY